MSRAVVYLRIPQLRNDFKPPCTVDWDSEKERELWKLLRNSSNPDWKSLAAHFDVSVQYILQQAAWLYEQELGTLKHKMSQINFKIPSSEATVEAPTRDSSINPSSSFSDVESVSSHAENTVSDIRSHHLLSLSTISFSDDDDDESESRFSAFT